MAGRSVIWFRPVMTMRAEPDSWRCKAGLLALVLLAAAAVPPELVGAAALTVSGLTALALGERHDAMHWFACLVVIQMIFGLPVVAMASIGVAFAVALASAPGPGMATIVPVTLVAAALGATLLPVVTGGSPMFGPVFCCLVAGAPGLSFEKLALRQASVREAGVCLSVLGPSLVAIVIGAWIWGACGAAGAVAAGILARPFPALLSEGPLRQRRRRRALVLAGVYSSALVGVLAIGAAMRVTPWPAMAAPLAVASALLAYSVALRVHAPGMARLDAAALRRGVRRLLRPLPAQNWH